VCVWREGDTVAEFIVPDWGDKVNSVNGLRYRPARLHVRFGLSLHEIAWL
jgi:hypothetical protein